VTHRRPVRRLLVSLAVLGFLVAVPAFPAGFQIMTQGARATGMGLAFTAVADDPTAIFYNPAGLGWQEHFSSEIGVGFITKLDGKFDGANPFPGTGQNGAQHLTTFVVPTFYAVIPLTQDINLGIGAFSPYGLGFRWDNTDNQWPGRFISTNAVIQTIDLNPVLSWKLLPSLSIAGGADYRLSKVQLERNAGLYDPLSGSVVDTAYVKLNSSIWDNHGWGWNAAIMLKPAPTFSIGASYRSSITIDYAGTATFTQILTGNDVLDAIVASRLPSNPQNVATSIKFPGSLNLGMAWVIGKNTTMSIEADWTQWSDFHDLAINFENPAIPDQDRVTAWQDAWAYRFGIEQKFGKWSVSGGYYYDNTPQPAEDVGPILADNDRVGYTIGFSYGTPRFSVNVSDLYLTVRDRTTPPSNTDNFYGTYKKEAVNIAIASMRFAF
jgi:long-chain fatty acid transport protein